MAEILLARQWGLNGFCRDVVVKRLFPHFASEPTVVEKLQYEAKLLSLLCHPNIPQMYDLGCDDGAWYLVMEFVEGHTITDLWRAGSRNRRPIPLPVAVGLIMQACEALHHAHERCDRAGHHLKIVHRDVTPQNLMVTRDGVVKLLDFGVARTAARTGTQSGGIRGTLAYMSPEQVRDLPLDERADVFSLGVILYEITTGVRLFRGQEIEVMTSIVEHDVRPPSHHIPEYPADLERVVMGALARDRRHRTRTAADIAAQLEHFALANGLLSGPRSIARYFNEVLPAQAVVDESLGIVEDRGGAASDEATGRHEAIELSEDEPDLVLEAEHMHIPAPLALDGLPLDHDSDEFSILGLEALASPGQPPEGLASLPPTVPPTPLAGFEVPSVERPVVLLENRKGLSAHTLEPAPDPYLDLLNQRMQELEQGDSLNPEEPDIAEEPNESLSEPPVE